MERMLKRSLALLMAAVVCFSCVACGASSTPSEASPAPQSSSAAPSESAEPEMTHDQLVEAAKAEGKVVVYACTSRISKAAEAFEAKYGIKVEATNLKDFELVEKISKEGATGAISADFVLAQDGGRVFGELLKMGYLENYVPPTMKDIIPVEYQEPLVFSFINKVFIYNNETTQTSPITNIWALADPEWSGRFQFKDPFQEGVNANFLTMVTSPEIADKIAAAYKKHYGKDIQLTTPNAGYEWIKAVYANNLVQGNSDTTIAENVGVRGQSRVNVGLFVYSKTRYDEAKNLALAPIMDMEPFSGFYYPIYALMCKGAKNPNAAKLFIEYLLTEEGFSPWSSDNGTYSPNPNVPINEGDYPLKDWEPILVREDPEYCFAHRAEVEEFLNQHIY